MQVELAHGRRLLRAQARGLISQRNVRQHPVDKGPRALRQPAPLRQVQVQHAQRAARAPVAGRLIRRAGPAGQRQAVHMQVFTRFERVQRAVPRAGVQHPARAASLAQQTAGEFCRPGRHHRRGQFPVSKGRQRLLPLIDRNKRAAHRVRQPCDHRQRAVHQRPLVEHPSRGFRDQPVELQRSF